MRKPLIQFAKELSLIKIEAIAFQNVHQHKINEFLKAHEVDSVHCLTKVYPQSKEFGLYWHQFYNYHLTVSSSFIVISDICDQLINALSDEEQPLESSIQMESVMASCREVISDFELKKKEIKKYEKNISDFDKYLSTLQKIELELSSDESWDNCFVGEFSILSSSAFTEERGGSSDDLDPFFNFESPYTPKFDTKSPESVRQEDDKELKQLQNGNACVKRL